MNNRWNPNLILPEEDENENENEPFDFGEDRRRRYDQEDRDRMLKTGFLALAITMATFVFGGIFLIGLATLVQWLSQMKG